MEDKLLTTSKEILVDMVKLAQKAGMKGEQGDWKEFLKVFDKQFGSSMSDPAKRTPDVLSAFILTFKEEKDINYFARLLKSFSNRERVKQSLKSQDSEPPEQRLVRLTLEHPHYTVAYSFPSHEEGWLLTRLGKKAKGKPSTTLLAVDCEMVLCEDGTEALVKICVVDRNLKIKLHEFVNPGKEISDYRTDITGVSATDLDGITCSVKDIQKSLRKLLSRGEILVGHALSNDLKAMKVDHANIIDTSFIFKYGEETTKKRPSLNDLCQTVLGYELRKKGASHNCHDDACAAMRLVLAKIEPGFNNVISVAQRDMPQVAESDKAMLLMHRIPRDLPSEELCQCIDGDLTIEVQASKKSGRDKYSALAIFKTPQDALNAYEKLVGDEEQDTLGRPQKLVSVQLSSGLTSEIYVRKMTADQSSSKVPKKRSSPPETSKREPKRLKTDEIAEISKESSGVVDQDEEIERLKKMLHQRDEEIASLHKIVAALTRKQGL